MAILKHPKLEDLEIHCSQALQEDLSDVELFSYAAFDEAEVERTGVSNYSYWRSTLRAFRKNHMAMFLLAPFAQALSLLLLPACLLAGGTAFLPGCLALLSATYAVTALLGLALSLGEGYGLRGMLPAILGYPLFMAAWPFLQVTALFRDVRSWREIPHRGSNPSGSPLQKRSPSPIR